MENRKQNILHRYSPFLIVICICIVLGSSVTYARYRSDFLTSSFWFTSALTENIYLRGEVKEEDVYQVRDGIWPEIPASWSYTDSEAMLKFSISNGYSQEEHSSRDQGVTVDLVALLAIASPENLTVTLTVTDMADPEGEDAQAQNPEEGVASVTYKGVARQITEGSRYYSTYGEGWVYQFYDEEENEVLLPLEGGALVYKNCTISVKGTGNASLLSLELAGKYTDTE